jgi:AAA15 family ATPase/GTPase
MLNSLEIKNYRNLKHLQIQKLGRVNLIVGKNNTGKTSVLEAISIHQQKGELEWIFQEILDKRNENLVNEDKKNYQDLMLQSLSYIFNNRITLNSSVEMGELFNERKTIIKIVKYIRPKMDFTDEQQPPEELKGFLSMMERLNTQWVEVEANYRGSKTGIVIQNGEKQDLKTLDKDRDFIEFMNASQNGENQFEGLKFIRSRDIQRTDNVDLWAKIALTEDENQVIEVLKILEENIDRLTFVRVENSDEQTPIVKLKGIQQTWPLSSMGDGINRLLTFILNLINCKDGYLLIDEFENGLHHSVQGKLWEVIFYLSEKLNIQVFATTHSSDSVRSFAQTLKDKKLPEEFGCLVRLENHDGNIIAREYDYNVLQSATEYNIETR